MRNRHSKPVWYYFSPDKYLYRSIKNIFGFYPKNIFLYKLAFLHKSAGIEMIQGVKVNNERLEYLGDAILDAIAADYLFKTFPLKDEGFLTEMRSKLVSRSQLNRLSEKLGLDTLINLDTGSSNHYKSVKGDALEAFIGALYLDLGYDYTRKIIINRIIRQFFNMDELISQEMNFKSRLIEWVQKERKQLSFNVVDELGTGYRKQYVVEILIDGNAVARGLDYSIKGAEQLASEKAWNNINPERKPENSV